MAARVVTRAGSNPTRHAAPADRPAGGLRGSGGRQVSGKHAVSASYANSYTWFLPRTAAAGGAEPGAGAWCASNGRVGDMPVYRLARCPPALGGPPHGCAAASDAARPSVIIMTVAMTNESFGLLRGEGLANRGPRGVGGFLDMLAEQVQFVLDAGRPTAARDHDTIWCCFVQSQWRYVPQTASISPPRSQVRCSCWGCRRPTCAPWLSRRITRPAGCPSACWCPRTRSTPRRCARQRRSCGRAAWRGWWL